MDGGKKVWVPDNEHGFRLGEIVDLGSDTITVEVDNSKGKVCETLLFCTVHWENVISLKIIKVANIYALFCQVVTAAYDRVFPSEKDNTRDFEDNCELKFVKPVQILSLILFEFDRITEDEYQEIPFIFKTVDYICGPNFVKCRFLSELRFYMPGKLLYLEDCL